MEFNSYRSDPLPLEEEVLSRMNFLNVRAQDRNDVFAMLAPLGAKRDAGKFHRDHSLRVGLLAAEIGASVYAGWSPMRALFFAGLLHDVGKALVPACTLCATTRWTNEDKVAMEAHVIDGFRLLRDRFDFSAHIIVWHHRFQNPGYPRELPAPLQPFSEETLQKAKDYGVLLMVADVFDALHRVNTATGGKALTSEEVRTKMEALHPELLGDLVPKLYSAGVLQ